MSERDEFEACPFCGCTDSPVQRGNGIGDVWLECAQCEASTRLRANIETCAKDWNRRASQAVPALTDEQIAAQDARYAIDGAIAYGRMGTNQPPAGHWLTEYWAIGQQLAKLGETSIWDNQTPVDKTVKFARYDAMEAAGRQASEEMRRLERYLEETSAPQPSPEPKEPEHAHDWRFSLQDHVYKCDCGATRGDYPFGAASFKD